MAISLLKISSLSTRAKLLHGVRVSLYNTSHGFHEEVKKILQWFPGGYVDLHKEDNGTGTVTLNNANEMNAFSDL